MLTCPTGASERERQPPEHHEIRVEPHPLDPTDAEHRQRVVVPQRTFPLPAEDPAQAGFAGADALLFEHGPRSSTEVEHVLRFPAGGQRESVDVRPPSLAMWTDEVSGHKCLDHELAEGWIV